MNGSNLFNLSDDDFTSHCCWKNGGEILSYLNKKGSGKGYYLLRDRTDQYQKRWPELVMDGHPSYSPDRRRVITDTYPDRKRVQSIYIMHGMHVQCLTRVYCPFRYAGDVRCDLHPRWSRDGKRICFDAAFEGTRQILLCRLRASLCDERLYHQASNDPATQEEHQLIVTGVAPHFIQRILHRWKPADLILYPNQYWRYSSAKRRGKEMNISVIIPCYNTGHIILETMASLEAQTFKTFEVIFINDGSTDGTLRLFKEFAGRTMLDVRIINQENQGVSSARNRGIAEAKNEYLVFLDSDDVWDPRFLESMAASTADGTDVSYCAHTRNLGKLQSAPASLPESKTVSSDQAMRELLFRMDRYSFVCYLYRQDIIQAHHLRFHEDTKFGEDREFIWKYLSHIKTAAKIDCPLYGYRRNAVSATNTYPGWKKTDLLVAIERLERYMEELRHPFYATFKDYMYPRAMWATAKTFAVHNGRTEYRKLIEQYDVKSCMRRMLHDRNKKVGIMSGLYLINPWLFFSVANHTPGAIQNSG